MHSIFVIAYFLELQNEIFVRLYFQNILKYVDYRVYLHFIVIFLHFLFARLKYYYTFDPEITPKSFNHAKNDL
ncbi:hypothetical protein FNO01nite_30790 [Flavobacterium noncentrifugens]|uniref:Uncharacterized protein n=1 Tax=Flavobacterium noncentrifugens TaxID=1128970 RepID=A0A1G9BXW8_9FLAO|nr:hypothetical protein FNO01nite_30790 [Flavobacterium noncentrifugens]SDK44299.1 hypothetical protein SAMN04487935_3396 [Flavobacterium noncentrifugens]